MKDIPLKSWIHIAITLTALASAAFVGRTVFLSFSYTWSTEDGHLDAAKENWRGAKENATDAMALEAPNGGMSRELRALAHVMMGDLDAADADYKAIANSGRPTTGMGEILVELYRINSQRTPTGGPSNEAGRLRALRAKLNPIVANLPMHGDSKVLDSRVLLGLLDLEIGDYDSALKNLRLALKACSGPPSTAAPSLPYTAAMYNGLGVAVVMTARTESDAATRREELLRALTYFRTAQQYHQPWFAPYANEARTHYLVAADAMRLCAMEPNGDNQTLVSASTERWPRVDRRLTQWLDADFPTAVGTPARKRLAALYKACDHEVEFWMNGLNTNTGQAIQHFHRTDNITRDLPDLPVLQWNAMCLMAGALKNSKRPEEVAGMLATRASILLQADPAVRDALPADLRAHAAAMAVAAIENYPSAAGPRGQAAQLSEFMAIVLKDSVDGTPPAPLSGYVLKQRVAAFLAREAAGPTADNAGEAIDLLEAVDGASEINDPRASSYWAEKLWRNYLIPAITPAVGGGIIADNAVRARLVNIAPRIAEHYVFVTDIDARLLGME